MCIYEALVKISLIKRLDFAKIKIQKEIVTKGLQFHKKYRIM